MPRTAKPSFLGAQLADRFDGNIDPVLNKALGVLGHAEFFEPVSNLLHRGHQGLVVADFWPGNKEWDLTAKPISHW